MDNQEKLALMRSTIDQLKELTDRVEETEIYPVSFFSQAYDITNKIRLQLHQIETDQVEALDLQLKAHQAQMQQEENISSDEEKGSSLCKPFVPDEIAAEVNTLTLTEKKEESTPLKKTTIAEEEAQQIHHASSSITTQRVEPSSSPKDEQTPLVDLRRLLTINERFRFARELFHQDDQLMNSTFDRLNSLSSLETSITYMKERFEWNDEEEVIRDFILFLEKRFH